MDIIAEARKFGTLIQKDERFIEYAKAKLASDADEELQKMIGEFNIIRMNIENETSKDDRDDVKVTQLNADLRKAYDDIMSTKSMSDFNKAKSAVDKMMNDIHLIIQAAGEGEDPETFTLPSPCTGSCESCGGCH